jgi:hypothetical protein
MIFLINFVNKKYILGRICALKTYFTEGVSNNKNEIIGFMSQNRLALNSRRECIFIEKQNPIFP